jgi:biotin transport system substrate-specific component
MVNPTLRLVLAAAMAVLTALSAQLRFSIGPVPYTMQNLGVVLSGMLLGPVYGAFSQLIYIGMIAVGIPAASGFKGGIGVLFGPTAGYIWMFPLAAFIAGAIRNAVWRKGSKAEIGLLWAGSCIASIPIYLVGFAVFYHFTTFTGELVGWCERATACFGLKLNPFWTIFAATVLIFVPQDFFVDHVIAIAVFAYLHELLKQKGIDYDLA